jgi:hypothetical protein
VSLAQRRGSAGTMLTTETVTTELRRWAAAYRRAAQSDGFAWIRETQRTNGTPRQRLKQIVEVVTLTVVHREQMAPASPQTLAWVKRFLSLQVHGSDFPPDAAYSITLLGPGMDVELFVDELRDVDLEDIHDAFGFAHLELRSRARITKKSARVLVQHIEDDLTYDGDQFKLSWDVEDGVLLVVVSKLDDSDDA